MCLFSRSNIIRDFLRRIENHKYFEWGILLLIFFSTLLLVADKPNSDKTDSFSKIAVICDKIMTVLFLLECLIKIIVYGFACNGPDSYLRSHWNKIDLFIALISCTAFLPIQNFKFLKALRLFRVLRPLRLVNRFPSMRIAIESIF